MDPRNQAPRPTRPQSKSGFSFRNSSSHHSIKQKQSLLETTAEKRKTHMSETTKANPNAAINEAQPVALALEKSTLSGLQNIRCNDIYGNPITDPDRSNPTRWKMERPLETIRSFDLAIDKAFAHRQSSYYQSGAPGMQSRRTSGNWGGTQGNAGYDQASRYSNPNGPQGGYGSSRNSYGESGYSGNGYNNGSAGYGGRGMQSDPALNRYGAPGVYPAVGSRSRDTLNTGASSGSEQWNNSTAPTSEGSSLERAYGVNRPPPNQYHPGYTDYGYSDDEKANPRDGHAPQRPSVGVPPASSSTLAFNGGSHYPSQQEITGPPRPPAKDPRPQPQMKTMISLNSTGVPTGAVQPAEPQRQSWFKKRFSKGK